jgi:hypothetical protein
MFFDCHSILYTCCYEHSMIKKIYSIDFTIEFEKIGLKKKGLVSIIHLSYCTFSLETYTMLH